MARTPNRHKEIATRMEENDDGDEDMGKGRGKLSGVVEDCPNLYCSTNPEGNSRDALYVQYQVLSLVDGEKYDELRCHLQHDPICPCTLPFVFTLSILAPAPWNHAYGPLYFHIATSNSFRFLNAISPPPCFGSTALWH